MGGQHGSGSTYVKHCPKTKKGNTGQKQARNRIPRRIFELCKVYFYNITLTVDESLQWFLKDKTLQAGFIVFLLVFLRELAHSSVSKQFQCVRLHENTI